MKRSDLQHYLMKKLILRLDYKGILESDLDAVVDLRSEFLSEGFRLDEGIRTDVNFKIGDVQLVEEQFPTKEITKSKHYVFQNDGITLSVEKNALILSANTEVGYSNAEKYISYFMKIVGLLADRYGGIISFERLGFRKINSVIIKSIDEISNYFDQNLYNVLHAKDNIVNCGSNVISSNERISFGGPDSKLNLTTEVMEGAVNNIDTGSVEKVYRVTFDIDAYKDKDISLDIEEELIHLNNKIFDVYISILTDDFANKLSEEYFEDECIIGGVSKIV